jgi:hypothetical protein
MSAPGVSERVVAVTTLVVAAMMQSSGVGTQLAQSDILPALAVFFGRSANGLPKCGPGHSDWRNLHSPRSLLRQGKLVNCGCPAGLAAGNLIPRFCISPSQSEGPALAASQVLRYQASKSCSGEGLGNGYVFTLLSAICHNFKPLMDLRRSQPIPFGLKARPVEDLGIDHAAGPQAAGEIEHPLTRCPADVAKEFVGPGDRMGC